MNESGVTMTHTQKIDTATPAGATGPAKAWRTEEAMMLGCTIWDMSLEQYTTALNGAGIVTTAAAAGKPGHKMIGLSQGIDVTLYALLARGPSPYVANGNAQYEVPRCYQNANPKPAFVKGKPAGLELEFAALEDFAATDPIQRFGRLRAAHTAAI